MYGLLGLILEGEASCASGSVGLLARRYEGRIHCGSVGIGSTRRSFPLKAALNGASCRPLVLSSLVDRDSRHRADGRMSQ